MAAELQAITDPQELLELSACAQDCPSEEFPQINAVTSYTAQGYTLYPTIIYPLTYEDHNGWIGISYIAKTYIKPGKPEHFGYMIYDDQQISPENAEMHLKKFCGEKVEIRKSGDGSEFEKRAVRSNDLGHNRKVRRQD